jgi:hypothetical protein
MKVQIVSREEVTKNRKEFQAQFMEVVREKKMDENWYIRTPPEYIACHCCNQEVFDASLTVINETQIICETCFNQMTNEVT